MVVERKTVADFMDTLTGGDRSMFEQVGDASRTYGRPVVIIEGVKAFRFAQRPPQGDSGALASLAVDFGASVLRTSDEDDTADLLSLSPRGNRRTRTLGERPRRQEYKDAE